MVGAPRESDLIICQLTHAGSFEILVGGHPATRLDPSLRGRFHAPPALGYAQGPQTE